MTRDELKEKVARALCRHEHEGYHGTNAIETVVNETWTWFTGAAEAALSAIEASGMAVVPVEPDDEFWSKVRFHEGEHSRSGETYPVQRNLHRAMVEAGRVR